MIRLMESDREPSKKLFGLFGVAFVVVMAAILACDWQFGNRTLFSNNLPAAALNKEAAQSRPAVSSTRAASDLIDGIKDEQLYHASTLSCTLQGACAGAICAIYGTNHGWGVVERGLKNNFYKNDFSTQTNYVAVDNRINFTLYHGVIGGNATWGTLDQVKKVYPTCEGNAADQLKKIGSIDSSKYNLYYAVQIASSTNTSQNQDFPQWEPKTIKLISYPADEDYGDINDENPETGELGFISRSYAPQFHLAYHWLKLCKNYQVYSAQNKLIQLSSVLGWGAEVFQENGCVSIVGSDAGSERNSEQFGIDPNIDATSSAAEIGNTGCLGLGEPMKDTNFTSPNFASGKLNYGRNNLKISRDLCPEYDVVDQNGARIAINSISPSDYVTVFHRGNWATRIQVTQRRASDQ
jgi:hypothetical protein